MLLVAFILFIASASACQDITTLSSCLYKAALPGSASACTCWSDWISKASDCTWAEYSTALAAAKTFCSTADSFSFTPKSCTDGVLAYSSCISTIVGTTSSICDCYSKFIETSNSYCTSIEEKAVNLGFCSVARQTCNSLTCDCSAVTALIPDTETNFETCLSTSSNDPCVCYTTALSQTTDYNFCNFAAEFNLKACVQTKLQQCSTLTKNECVTTSVSLKLSDLDALFTQYHDKFVNLWNSGLSTAGVVISTLKHELPSAEEIKWTLSLTFDEAQKTIAEVEAAIKAEFVASVGLTADQISCKVETSAKRSTLNTPATATVTGTNSQSNTSSGSALTFIMLPLIAVIGVFHYFL